MHHGGLRHVVATVAAAVLLAGLMVSGAAPASAAATCGSRTGTAYTVSVCLDPALDGSTLTGTSQVTAAVTVTPAGAVPIDRVAFFWNGGDALLADHDPDPGTGTYRMTLRSERLTNGTGTLSARAFVDDPSSTTPRPTTLSTAAATVSNAAPPPPAGPFVARTAAPGPDGRVRLAVVGDGVDGSPESLAVAAQIAGMDPDVFAYLGDVYDNGTPFEFDTWYGDPAGYGQFRGITNPAIGNHEYGTDGARPYLEYWGGVPHYYSYDVAGWHLVVLDSTTEFAECDRGGQPAGARFGAVRLAGPGPGCPPGQLHDRLHAPPSLQQRRGVRPGTAWPLSGSCSSTRTSPWSWPGTRTPTSAGRRWTGTAPRRRVASRSSW